jgi:signal transduction histidine kinase
LPAAGVEIHAQILDSILSGRSLRILPLWANGLLIFGTCLGAVALLRNRRGWRLLSLILGFGAMSYLIGLAIFALQSRIPPIGPMLLAAAFAPVVVYGDEFVALDRRVRIQLMGLRHWLIGHRPYQLAEDADDIGRNLDVLQELQSQLGGLYELHQTLLEATHDAVGIFDLGGALILQNRKFGAIFGSQMHFTRQEDIQALLDWREGADEGTGREGEAQVRGELFSIREIALPPTTLSPQGGTIWLLSSLQAREERDRSRAEVLGFITHELRTPLTAIQGFSELMIQFPGSPHCTNAPQTIFRESKRLLALIHSYLDVLRLDAGAREPVFEQIDVAGLVRKVFEVLQPIAASSGMKLAWLGNDACIFGDEALLHGAILNVVSNAIKYGEKAREISVCCSHQGEGVAIAVHNFGRRIDSRDLPNVFSSYYRGVGAGGRTPGWGLGLAFVKRIAETHGGHVAVQSSEDGTTFSIHLPVPVPINTLRSLS